MSLKEVTYEKVKLFLDQMKSRITLLGGRVLFGASDKNDQFMVEMEWFKTSQKIEWLLNLVPEDYYQGPIDNIQPTLSPVWIFGKRIEGRLCYIKVYLIQKINVYCISFHFAEHDMYLPLKNVTEKI